MAGKGYIEGKEERTDLSAILAALARLRGEPPVSIAVVANWNTGFATSGNAGADLVTIGAAEVNYKVHSLIVSMRNLTLVAMVTIRMYTEVNGVEDEVYNQTFIKGTDPDGIWVINGTLGIHKALRVEVYSNKVADDGAAIDYDYMLEAM